MNNEQKTELIRRVFSLSMKAVRIRNQVIELNSAIHDLLQELVHSEEFENPTTVLSLIEMVNEARLRNLNIRR